MSKTYVVGIVIIIVLLVVVGYNFARNGSSKLAPTARQLNEEATLSRTEQSLPKNNTAAAPTPEVATASSTASQAAITLTDSGYSPQLITVKIGEVVTFTNNSSESMWVASDPHPTHTDYDGFDARKAMSKGQTYSFTFNKTGHWGYHNHLDPSQVGTVIVE